jgi:hypothetical protein
VRGCRRRESIVTEISNSKGFRFMEGRFRIIQEPDGFCVVGEGLVLPVDSYEEGLELIKEIEEKAPSRLNE